MTAFALAFLLAFAPVPPLGATLGSGTPPIPKIERTQLPATGLATYYNAGIFERVVRNQVANGSLRPDACPDCVGYAALLWPSDVGRVVCVQGLRLLVVDNAADAHRPGLIKRDWLIDVDRATWLRLGWKDTPTLTTVAECGT